MGDVFTASSEFKLLTVVFRDFCKEKELTILATGVEKHGSWEWSGVRLGDINRYISVALTEDHEIVAGGPRSWVAEVWAEGDNSQRFVRRLTSAFRLIDQTLENVELLRGPLLNRLEAALQQAAELKEGDLVDAYLRPARS